LILDSGEKLWLGTALPEGGGFMVSGPSALPGILEIDTLIDGNIVPYTYTATEASVELSAAQGSIQFVIDKDAQALRVSGQGVTLRLDATISPPNVMSIKTEQGIAVSIGGIRYLFVAKKGKVSFDDTYDLAKYNSVRPIYDIEPEDGIFELIIFDLPPDTDIPEIHKTPGDCARENSDAFRAFCSGLVSVPPELSDIRESIAYILWIGHRQLANGSEIIVDDKRKTADSKPELQAIASLAFADFDKIVSLLLALPISAPPFLSIAVNRLLEEEDISKAPRSVLYELYNAIETSSRWWIDERSIDGAWLSYYAYRFENGLVKLPAYFKVGEPVLAPDLNAYLVLQSETIHRLAELVLESGNASKWEDRSKKQSKALFSELWNGEGFVGINVYTGAASAPDPLLSFIPLILGSRLPGEIADKLAETFDDSIAISAVGLVLTLGLYRAGKTQLAKEIALKAVNKVRDEGASCPFFGAALLALAHAVL
jgi:hypothetical protein